MSILLERGARLVIAHRGDSANAPENTLESFQRGVAAGADALELDVRMTRDGVAVVIHDAALDRTTSSSGVVGSLALDELRRVDAGARFTPDGGQTFPYLGRGVRVPTLGEVIDAFPAMPFVIELKEARAQIEVRRILTDLSAVDRCVIGSFSTAALAGIPRPPFRTGGPESELIRLYLRSAIRLPKRRVNYDAIFATRRYKGFPVPVGPFLAAGRALGIPVHLWVENVPADAIRLWDAGVTGIITDAPTLILAARAESPPTRIV